MKYPEIQRLMLEGQWDRALLLLRRISARYPDDDDALKLTQVCRTMSDIRSALAPVRGWKTDSRVNSLLYAEWKKLLSKLCDLYLRVLSKLPEFWRLRLGYAKCRQWNKTFSENNTAGEKLSLTILFCDPLWRKIIFSIICGMIAAGVVLIVWTAWSASSEKIDYSNLNFHAVLQKAQKGDPQSQYQLGAIFYWGTPEIPKDADKSYYWLSLAAKSGHADASKLLAKVVFEKENRQ